MLSLKKIIDYYRHDLLLSYLRYKKFAIIIKIKVLISI